MGYLIIALLLNFNGECAVKKMKIGQCLMKLVVSYDKNLLAYFLDHRVYTSACSNSSSRVRRYITWWYQRGSDRQWKTADVVINLMIGNIE